MEPETLLLILSFLICSFLGAAIMLAARRVATRKRSFLDQRLGVPDDRIDLPTLVISPEYRRTHGVVGRFDNWFNRMIVQTGMEIVPEAAFLLAVAVGLLLGGILLLWRDDLLLMIFGVGMGMLLVIGYYAFRRARHQTEIQNQLPDAMELLARAVRAGESLDQAIELASDTLPKPLGPEFQRCSKQLSMGLSIDAAMRSLSMRAPLSEIRILAATLMVQRRTGGSLPVTLERLSAVIRDRINYHRQFRAQTAAGRISTLLIGAAGPLVAAYMLTFQPEYFQRFMETSRGNMMLGTSVVLQVIGLGWIYTILRSDY